MHIFKKCDVGGELLNYTNLSATNHRRRNSRCALSVPKNAHVIICLNDELIKGGAKSTNFGLLTERTLPCQIIRTCCKLPGN